MATKKKWSELSGTQRRALSVAGGVEVVLTVVALADLVRRPGNEVRGPKALWVLGCFVQPIGPVAYLAWGRA